MRITCAALWPNSNFSSCRIFSFRQTCRFADVVLPASPSLEKEGTFTSTERRIQRLYQVFEPLGGSQPDWKIIQDIANRLGADWKYKHPSEIYREIASLTPMFAGVTYERLEGYKSLQWPVASGRNRPAAALYKTIRIPGRQGQALSAHVVRADRPAGCGIRSASEQRPDARTFSRRQHDLSRGRNSREDAGYVRRGIAGAGAGARDSERNLGANLHRATAKCACARWSPTACKGKELYMPMNSVESPVNRLTGSHTDKATHTPAYKETSVRMRVLAGGRRKSRCRASNSRFGHPTPQKRRGSRAQMEARRIIACRTAMDWFRFKPSKLARQSLRQKETNEWPVPSHWKFPRAIRAAS